MSNREKVLQRFPNATIKEHIGCGVADWDGFVVFSNDRAIQDPLSTGDSEDEAWERALDRC